jgi:hypothetical protein
MPIFRRERICENSNRRGSIGIIDRVYAFPTKIYLGGQFRKNCKSIKLEEIGKRFYVAGMDLMSLKAALENRKVFY